ncbi:peptidase [Sulfitobacter sp. M57]|uniref:imelysin family protein n=1 Tax=unclassified Sulfitobacter TaxID=196795 RepID=UPI0023E1A962|nr:MULTISPECIES: imelysin family protein [unclassified Sulfitobacter]MDF3414987.1 peptidase [Sulfitobacter sp. KE5]MDF3422468.1 peptidase [Sulfitobacter sp. KE43]MDF3433533.1 peptidase [Sulfitobacter sp. KE42]MDF3459173.1 peptidase [Sulfitobacter sp. S74]MDF3463072.1 peptidase [Sulfitobacter sp. Ks18]
MKTSLSAILGSVALLATPAFADKLAVLDNYADIAEAKYSDSLTTAQTLLEAVKELTANPSAEALQTAKTAWLASRVPYQQTEVYRFGNAIVDDWEGKVNAWPLDEGLIDYVDAVYGGATDENAYAVLNVVANPSFTLSGSTIDAGKITPALLEGQLHEADGIESNVATGYHAIEFLLWGQDLNGHGAGAGARPWTDFAAGTDCTNGNCDRRGDYLTAATELLVSDLAWMADQWKEGGAARAAVMENEDAGISAMLTGMGSLSYGEQAGERMRLGVMLNDPEEEHDCFSDNTHNSHFYDALGIRNVYLGSYTSIDGTIVNGASLSSLVADADSGVDTELRAKLNNTMLEMSEMKTAAEAGFAYDSMLERGSEAGEALIMGAVDALVDQTRSIERAVAALGVEQIAFEGSDSLDDPEAVFK